ncbi:hypothetical protein [Actinoplanes sp. NPDC026623]|uniref:NACHT domain-containing protein n=1 Tax=Actinoplanes sp. NPDC026623 TaxID=3155610 RepID=UPI0033C31535
MGDYPLHQLGTLEFEHMTQSLLAAFVGPANVRVLGAGRDGGRELTTRATFEVQGGLQWSGYTVAQAKFRARPGSPGTNATWLRAQVRKELNDWIDPTKNRYPKPENLLFVTNVVLSAVPGHGLDHVEEVFDEFADKLPLKAYAVWHYDHVCRLLDDHPGVRAAYAGLLTTGDVLTQLSQVLLGEAVDIGQVLHRHAAKELVAEQWVRLGESGSRTNEKLQIGQIGIDLHAELEPAGKLEVGKQLSVLAHMIGVGDGVLRPSICDGAAPHRVLVGGPGQGKTTLSQLLCQIYRTHLIADLGAIGPQAAAAVTTLRQHFAAQGLPTPTSRRWPLRVDLGGYADVLGGSPDTSLLRYLATRISERSAETITAPQLLTWLKSWPWLLILDGFDEVVAPKVREVMIDRIGDFFIDAGSVDADLMVIATTRPQGYSAEFSPSQYQHLRLMPLTQQQAVAYARMLADVRLADDPDARANVLARASEAAKDPLTARLMTTPLQVTIMSLLLEGRARVPQDRYSLFADYYRTIYSREVAKSNATARLLEQHRRTVDKLHDKVGLQLQNQAEATGGADVALPHLAVQQMARTILDQEDYPAQEAEELAHKIAKAATTRLVLLVPKHLDSVGFDVRSLQELMAARAVTTGPDERVMARLRAIALSAHWRNTFLLAAGRIAVDRSHLVDAILNLLEDLDTSSYLSLYLHPAARAALDLLDDRFAAPSPRVEMKLVHRAIGILQSPPARDLREAADILQRVSITGSNPIGSFIADAAKFSLAGNPPQQITAAMMLTRWTAGTGALATLGRQRTKPDHSELGPAHAAAIEGHFLTNSNFVGGLLQDHVYTGKAVDVSDTVTQDLPEPAPRSTPQRSADLDLAPLGQRRWHQSARTVASHLDLRKQDQPLPPGFTTSDVVAWDGLMQEFERVRVAMTATEAQIPIVPRFSMSATPVHRALARPAVSDLLAERLLGLDPDQWAIASTVTHCVIKLFEWLPAREELDRLT